MSEPLELKSTLNENPNYVITQYLVDEIYVGIVQDGYGNLLEIEIV